jgi:hypothetical protein
MNKKFKISRVGWLMHRYFIENISREIMFWAIISLLFTILDQRDFVLLVIFITGIYNSVFLNKDFSVQTSGMHYLLIPATHAEKLTTKIILGIFYHFAMSLIAYVIGNLLIILIYHTILRFQIPVNWDIFISSQTIEVNGILQIVNQNELWKIIGLFALTQSIFLLGSLSFKRHAILKTLFCVLCLIFIVIGLQLFLFKTMWDVKHLQNALLPVLVMISDSTIPDIIEKAIIFGSFLILPFLWTVSYFKLKEKQI